MALNLTKMPWKGLEKCLNFVAEICYSPWTGIFWFQHPKGWNCWNFTKPLIFCIILAMKIKHILLPWLFFDYFSIHMYIQCCQWVPNFRILCGFYMQNTGVRIWPKKYGQFCHLKYCCQNKAYLFWVANQSRYVALHTLKPSNTSLITKTINLLSSTCGSNLFFPQLPVPVVLKESTRVSTGSAVCQWFPPE